MLMLRDGSLEALLVGLCLVEACLTTRRLPRGFLSTACARYAALSYNFNFFLLYGFISHPDPYELFDLFNMSQHFNNFFFLFSEVHTVTEADIRVVRCKQSELFTEVTAGDLLRQFSSCVAGAREGPSSILCFSEECTGPLSQRM